MTHNKCNQCLVFHVLMSTSIQILQVLMCLNENVEQVTWVHVEQVTV